MAINLDDNLNINAAKPTRTTDLVGTGQLYATKEDIPAYLLFEGLTTYDIDNSAAWIYQGAAWVANEVDLGNFSFDGDNFESKGDAVLVRTQTVPSLVDKLELKLFNSSLMYDLASGISSLKTTYDANNQAFLNEVSAASTTQLTMGIKWAGGTRHIIFYEDEIRFGYTIAEIDAALGTSAVTKEWVNAYKASLYATKKTEAGTSYTIQASDLGKNIHFTAATAITVTLPNGLATGFKCNLIKAAAGNVTITATTTLHSNGNALKSLYTMAEVIHEGSNVWSAYGGKLTV